MKKKKTEEREETCSLLVWEITWRSRWMVVKWRVSECNRKNMCTRRLHSTARCDSMSDCRAGVVIALQSFDCRSSSLWLLRSRFDNYYNCPTRTPGLNSTDSQSECRCSRCDRTRERSKQRKKKNSHSEPERREERRQEWKEKENSRGTNDRWVDWLLVFSLCIIYYLFIFYLLFIIYLFCFVLFVECYLTFIARSSKSSSACTHTPSCLTSPCSSGFEQ